MATFRYRLTTLLRLRESERRHCRLELAEAQQEEEQAAARVTDLNRQLVSVQLGIHKSAQPGHIDVDRLRNARRYEQQLRADLHQAQEIRRAAAAEVESRRQTLLLADQEVHILEKHRELLGSRHRAGESKLEIKQLDEQAIQIAQRAR
jgi:flagellar export protein FliJ